MTSISVQVQSRTGGVLAALPSAAVQGRHSKCIIFFILRWGLGACVMGTMAQWPVQACSALECSCGLTETSTESKVLAKCLTKGLTEIGTGRKFSSSAKFFR